MCRRTCMIVSIVLLLVGCADAPATPTPVAPALPSPVAVPTVPYVFPTPTARPRETRVPIPRPRTLPYTVPTSCAASPMAGAEVRRGFPAWWLDGMGLWAGNPLGNYYVGGNKVQWQPDQMGPYNQNDAITATGTRLDSPAPPMKLDNPVNIGTGYSSGVYFPTPGCWQMHGAVGTQTLDATVYVYPDGCAPELLIGPPMFACTPPEMQAVATSCPVTRPPNPPLTPPPAVSAGEPIGTGGFWYGTDGLWVTLPSQGSLLQSDKKVWWHTIPGWLAVEGRRLDMPAPPLMVRIPPGYDEMNLQAMGLDFPTLGCWEVVGRLAGRELRFVTNVEPNPSPSSIAATGTASTSATATASSCPVTQPPNPPLTPPENVRSTNTGEHRFWWGNDSQWVILPNDGVMWSAKFMWWRTLAGQLTIEGRRLDAPAPPLESSISSGDGDIGFQATGLSFPTTGCWEVIGRVSGHELRFVVNVIPAPLPYSAATAVPLPFANAATSEETWARLRRPLTLPSVAAGDACPVSTSRSVSPTFGLAAGDGPVYAVGLGNGTITRGPIGFYKTLWVAHRSYTGPILIRGQSLYGNATLMFQEGVPGTSEQELRLAEGPAYLVGTEDWRDWASETLIPGPGCYAFQVDGDTFSEVITFRAI